MKGVCSNTNTSSASSSVVTCTRVNSNTGLGNSGYINGGFGKIVRTVNTPVALLYQVNYYDPRMIFRVYYDGYLQNRPMASFGLPIASVKCRAKVT